jgi:hypothetical protein
MNNEARHIEATLPAPTSCDAQAVQAAEAQVAMEWKVGDVILDLYEVKQIHAGGGMGLVYRAYQRNWNQDLAVKSPRPEFFRTPAHKENFVRECLTWIGLGLHPHIVCCYYIKLLGDLPRVFAEYVEGGSPKDWIDSKKLFEGHTGEVQSVCLSSDGRWVLSGSTDETIRLWELDWEYEFPGWADWDDGARPYLSIFLTLHCPIAFAGFSRVGKPAWNEENFQGLIKGLQHRGFGWLRPEGVRKKLDEMAAECQGPPPLPGSP